MTKQEMYHAEIASQCKGLMWGYNNAIGFAPTERLKNIIRGQVKGYELAYKALNVGDTLTWLNKLVGDYAVMYAEETEPSKRDVIEGKLDALRHVRDAIVDDKLLYNEE